MEKRFIVVFLLIVGHVLVLELVSISFIAGNVAVITMHGYYFIRRF